MTKLFTPIRIVLLVLLALTIAAGFVLVPAGTSLPVHWNIAGEADGFLPREWALLVPAGIVVLVWGIFFAVDRFASEEQRAAGISMAGAAMTAITTTVLGISAGTVLIGLGVPVNMVQVIAFAVALLLVVLGNAMPKSRPNSYAGIRMPTTLRSESNWVATHRLGGVLTIAGGLVLLVAAFAAPTSALVWWIIGCVLIPMLIAAGYSLLLARRAA